MTPETKSKNDKREFDSYDEAVTITRRAVLAQLKAAGAPAKLYKLLKHTGAHDLLTVMDGDVEVRLRLKMKKGRAIFHNKNIVTCVQISSNDWRNGIKGNFAFNSELKLNATLLHQRVTEYLKGRRDATERKRNEALLKLGYLTRAQDAIARAGHDAHIDKARERLTVENFGQAGRQLTVSVQEDRVRFDVVFEVPCESAGHVLTEVEMLLNKECCKPSPINDYGDE